MEKQIIAAVKEMRKAQTEYLRTIDKEVLLKSKALENKVDELLAKYENQEREPKIGDSITVDGEEYLCVDATNEDCSTCDFLIDGDCKSPSWLKCYMENRFDKKDVKFKRRVKA